MYMSMMEEKEEGEELNEDDVFWLVLKTFKY